ncbi:MAG: hypothetical protein HEQ23_11795 [Tepidisphaera sp.]
MKNIAGRVADPEGRMGVVRTRQHSTEADAAFERLMCDDQSQAAVLAFYNHMHAHHPDAANHRAAVAADERVAPLIDAIAVAAQRANAGAWLATWGHTDPPA